MRSNVQIGLEQQRVVYESLGRPLLAQLAELHGITIREFAEIFGISKSHAEEILNHKTLPALDVAIRIARYWEVAVEDLFGWRLDDDGTRCPLVVYLPEAKGKRVTLVRRRDYAKHDPLRIVHEVAKKRREQG